MKNWILPLIFVLLKCTVVLAQQATALFNEQTFQCLDIPVSRNGAQLANPWAGGLNAPQWSSVDLDNDGWRDLYVFDRTGGVHLAFLNQGGTTGQANYRYDRAVLKYFPAVQNFVLMRDFNQDGAADMFCSSHDESQNGLKVFEGSWKDGALHFERILFPSFSHDVLTFTDEEGATKRLPVHLLVDYPAVEDVDGDGDLDVLTMNQAANKVHFYKNVALESGFTTDTLLYQLADDCWGRFGLTLDTQAFSLSLDPALCAFFNDPDDDGETRHIVHGGTTLCTYDNDNDGDLEILYGDLLNNFIIFGKNNGTPANSWISEQDTVFPGYDTPIDIPFFSATFYLDLNNDGANDLIASPNQIWFTPDIETAWLYENIGSQAFPEFRLAQKDFLSDGLLDFGTGANPAFADVNADGLLDIVCGNREYWTPNGLISRLALLLNTGTSDAPAFELTDEDWLGFGQMSPALAALAPAFGDLDNDGDEDLLLGDRSGNLHFLENTAGPGMPMQFAPMQFNWRGINVGQFSTPFVHDMNQDGLPDLLIGELRGTVNYLPNTGTQGIPDFHPIPDEAPNNFFFGKINTQPPGGTVGYTQPYILRFGDTMQLVTGSFEGWIKRYLVNPDSLDGGAFELLDETWGGIREGSTTRIALANLNGDEFLEAIVGNTRGGLTAFRSPINGDGLVNGRETFPEWASCCEIYPNPSPGIFALKISPETDISVHDLLGRLVFLSRNASGEALIDLSRFGKGTYFIGLRSEAGACVKKVVVY